MALRWRDLILAAPLAVTLAAAAVVAQPARPFPPGERAPFSHPPFHRPPFEARVEGVPFRAESVAELVATGKDGSPLTRRVTGLVARDTAGRTRHEEAMGPDADRMVAIDDPVANVRYVFFPDREEGRKFTKRVPGPMGERFRGPRGAEGAPRVKTESLGTDIVAGVSAEGTRDTVTLPAGVHGNQSPVEIVHERWYSEELKTVVRRRHRDARGERTWTLTEITREEPDASLFEAPAGIALEEGNR